MIEREDLERKFREVEDTIVAAEEDVRDRSVLVAVGIAAVVVGLVAFSIWRARRRRIRVEVYYQP